MTNTGWCRLRNRESRFPLSNPEFGYYTELGALKMSQNLPGPENEGSAQRQAVPGADTVETHEAVYARYAAEAAALRAHGREEQYRGPNQPDYVSTAALCFMDDVTVHTALKLLEKGFAIDVGRFAGRNGAFPPARVDARFGVALNIENASKPPFRILHFDSADDEGFHQKLRRLAGLARGGGGAKDGKCPRRYERKRFRHRDLVFWFQATDEFWNLCEGIFDTRPDIVRRELASRKASWHMKNDNVVYIT